MWGFLPSCFFPSSFKDRIRALTDKCPQAFRTTTPDLLMLLFTFPLGFLVSFFPPRHTLWKRVQKAVTEFLALLIAVIDRNGNLELLARPAPEWVTKLWMFIFSDTKLLTVPSGGGKNR